MWAYANNKPLVADLSLYVVALCGFCCSLPPVAFATRYTSPASWQVASGFTVPESRQSAIPESRQSAIHNSMVAVILIDPLHNLREFVLNSRHPDPRRVWKVGSGARLLPPLRRDPRDPRDQRDPGKSSETSIFDNPSVDFEK